MPQQITTFNTAQDALHMVWKEPYLTEAVNQANLAVRPKGTYRGFRLATGATTTITITPDPVMNDHVSVVYDTTGTYALELRRTGGSFTANLSAYCGGAYAGQTIYITLVGTYGIGSTTAVYLQTYTATEFAAAPESAYVAVLGTVVIPATFDVTHPIPATDINYNFRTEAWAGTAPEANPWTPVLINGGFDLGPPGTLTYYTDPRGITGNINNFQLPGWLLFVSGATPTGTFLLESSDVNPSPGPNLFPGTQALEWDYGTSAQSWSLTQYLGTPTYAGQQVQYSFWMKAPQGAPTSGVLELLFSFNCQNSSGNTDTLVVTIPNSTFTAATSQWVQVAGTVVAPAVPLVNLRDFLIQSNSLVFATPSSAAIRLDDVQVWVETNSPAAPNLSKSSRGGELVPGDLILMDRQSNANPDVNTSDSSAVLHFDSTSVGVPAGGQLIYERRDQSATSAPPYLNVKGQVTLGQNLIGTAANDQIARLEIPADESSGAAFTLIQETPQTGGSSTTGSRIYISSTGDYYIVNNAIWDNTANLWSYENSSASASAIVIRGVTTTLIYGVIFTGGGPTWTNAVPPTAGGWSYQTILIKTDGSANLGNTQIANLGLGNSAFNTTPAGSLVMQGSIGCGPLASAPTTPGAIKIEGASPGTPDTNTIYKESLPKAWVMCTTGSGSSATINASFNVSSVSVTTSVSPNDSIQVNFATNFSSGNYVPLAMAGPGVSAETGFLTVYSQAAGNCVLIPWLSFATGTFNLSTTAIPFYVVFFGSQ